MVPISIAFRNTYKLYHTYEISVIDSQIKNFEYNMYNPVSKVLHTLDLIWDRVDHDSMLYIGSESERPYPSFDYGIAKSIPDAFKLFIQDKNVFGIFLRADSKQIVNVFHPLTTPTLIEQFINEKKPQIVVLRAKNPISQSFTIEQLNQFKKYAQILHVIKSHIKQLSNVNCKKSMTICPFYPIENHMIPSIQSLDVPLLGASHTVYYNGLTIPYFNIFYQKGYGYYKATPYIHSHCNILDGNRVCYGSEEVKPSSLRNANSDSATYRFVPLPSLCRRLGEIWIETYL